FATAHDTSTTSSLHILHHPITPLFPCTTLFRSCGVIAATPYRTALTDGNRMPGARWFDGATLNYAENLLAPQRDGAAIIFGNERDRKSTRLNSSHVKRSYAVFCLKKKKAKT